MNIILYTTHCPKCNVLKQKMDSKQLQYETVTDVEVMSQKGFRVAPMLEVDGNVMDFLASVQFINNLSNS
jgi:glutaredoxin